MNQRQRVGFLLGILILVVFLLAPAPEGMSPLAMRAAGVTLLVAAWWVTETIPIAATALVPLLLFPVLGVLDTKAVAAHYGHPYVWMLLGGFILAKAIEAHHLHKRIALTIISLIGTKKRTIMLSFMVATAFLSMWIANVAVTLMMLPIGLAVIDREETEHSSSEPDQFGLALMLSIAYAASVGGIGTLIGTPPNMVFAGMVGELYPDAPEIGFFQWMLVGVPLSAIFLPIIWLYLSRFFRISGTFSQGRAVIQQELRALGLVSAAEKRVGAIFVLTALGWMFRKDFQLGDHVLPGWASLLGLEDYVHDATVAIFSALLLFVVPTAGSRSAPLMRWALVKGIPWNVLILLGGGFAVAAAFASTGLAQWIGNALNFINQWPIFVVLLFVVFLIIFLTEISSNTATANIFLPILATTAVAGQAHPFLLMIPGAIAASCAFMLPSGTGTNAVVFGSGRIRLPDMARAGFWLNIIGVVVVTLVMYLIAIPVFGIATSLPDWAH